MNATPTQNSAPRIDPSFHITGNHPTREADAEDRQSPAWIVAFQRGFEQLQVAVYGDGLCEADAEEAAIEWLTKHAPQSLRSDEIGFPAPADYVFRAQF